MATLVLTTAGSLLGGPIGGAIGAAIGNGIDRRLLAPKGRQGPRLGDLTVQTSSYGAAIPRLFGRMRVAGTVIWATDLREDAHRSGGGKSGAKTTTYSYSASFAVALSARPILDVGRIWADGRLLRGAAGDWKSETGFRLHPGGEAQAADPLIASAEGAATTAHRGMAYAVFEDMQLAEFGNRLPSLTFEVIADDGPVPVGAILTALTDGAIGGDAGAAVGGFAASGDSVRGAIEALAAVYPLPLRDDGATMTIAPPGVTAIDAALAGARTAGTAPARQTTRQAADMLPQAVSIGYYEPSRDYQAGLQQARHAPGGRADRIELAAAIEAGEAKRLAEGALRRARAQRTRRVVQLPWQMIEARAGMRVALDDGLWRIAEWRLEGMVLSLDLVREGAAAPPGTAAAGRAAASDDLPAGTTIVAPLDLPPLDDAGGDGLRLWVAAAGTGIGWRRATLTLTTAGGAPQPAGRTAQPAVLGVATTVLAPGSAMLFDDAGTVEIELAHDGMALAGAGDDALLAGANLAMLGDELIQFGSIFQTGARRYRLRRLLRGRRGSEDAMATHAAGERFVMVEAATLAAIDLPVAALDTVVTIDAAGPGDGSGGARATRMARGRALRPPAPVHLTATRLPDGTIRFAWTRRSRQGWSWLDGVDAPLGEDGERYRIEIVPGAGKARTVMTAVAAYDHPLADQIADGGAAAGAGAIAVAQIGTHGASPTASIAWTF